MIGVNDPKEQLALLRLSPPPVRDAPAVEFRLMTWNVQRAARARARGQAAWLASHEDADVLVLTEVTDSPGGHALIQALREYGYHVIVPDSAGGEYLVLLASRVGVLEAVPSRLGYLPARFAAVRAILGAHSIGVAGLYVPSRGPRERRNTDKRMFQETISAYLPRLATDLGSGPIVVAGDFSVVEPAHQPHYAVFGDWEYRFYTRFSEHGLVDAFRELHPQVVEHSWFGRGGNGYRFDHVFLTRQHRGLLRACRYVHQPRLEGLSDHAAVTVTLALDP
jgi:exodeoxyribonuclease III